MNDKQCIKCAKIFSSESNLSRHQKTSKSCGSDSYNCIHCTQKFTSKYGLDYHLVNTCDKKKDEEKQKDKEIIEEFKMIVLSKDEIIASKDKKLEEQDAYYDKLIVAETVSKEKLKVEFRSYKEQSEKQIEKLEKIIEGLHDKMLKLAATKSASTVNNNNTTNNITLNMFITPEFVKLQASTHLTYEHFANGFKGIANFIHDFVLVNSNGKLVYACYDKARHILRYRDDNGTEIDDIDAEKLIAIVGPPIREKYTKICKELREDIMRFQKIIDDEDETQTERADAKQLKSKAEFSLRVMEMQNTDVCMIGMSKDKRMSRAIEKSCLIVKS